MVAAAGWLLLLAVPLSAAKFIRRDAEDSMEEATTRIKLDGTNFLVREDANLMISCVYEGNDIGEMADLKWKTSGGKQIDGESSSSVFTIAIHEKNTHYKKKTLHFTMVKPRDAGNYTCEGKNVEGQIFKRTVTVNVIDKIKWSSAEDRVGGLVGEPLTIDCGATADPEPQIQITDKEGEPLDDLQFTIAGSEISVASLTKVMNGFKINCVALQLLTELDQTATDQKTVTIDVWYTPEFEREKIDRHTILGRSAVLPCNVTSSNPPARHFNFFRNNVLLTDEKKYVQVMEVEENAAYLKVLDVQSEDLGEYSCEVNNGRAKATQIINLKEANPPEELKVSLQSVKQHSLGWRVQTNPNDILPVETIEIKALRKEELEDHMTNGEDDEEKIWKNKANTYHKAVSENETYEISHLRADTEYAFRFRAESEAGHGPYITISAFTNDQNNSPAEPLTDASPAYLPVSIFLSLLTVFLYL